MSLDFLYVVRNKYFNQHAKYRKRSGMDPEFMAKNTHADTLVRPALVRESLAKVSSLMRWSDFDEHKLKQLGNHF